MTDTACMYAKKGNKLLWSTSIFGVENIKKDSFGGGLCVLLLYYHPLIIKALQLCHGTPNLHYIAMVALSLPSFRVKMVTHSTIYYKDMYTKIINNQIECNDTE